VELLCHKGRWQGLCWAAAVSEGSDGRQLAAVGAVAVAVAVVAGLLQAGRRADHFSPKLFVCKA